jgi:DNA-binding transcriptional LysR family regulator
VELRHLRYFVAVAEELHFRKAAERLHIVQPALSKQIASLEHELGIVLLERTKRKVQLTEAGMVLLEDARQLLAHAEGAVERAHLASRGEMGTLNIGFIPPILYGRLPVMVRRYRSRYPRARVNLRELGNAAAVGAVLSGENHLGFVRLPIERHPDLSCLQVLEEPIMLAVPTHHRLAAESAIAVSSLADESLILIPRAREPELHDFYISLCATAGFSAKLVHEADRTHVVMGLVAAGLGIAFVSTSTSLVSYPGVVFVPIAEPAPRMSIGMIWRNTAVPPVLSTFLKLRPWEGGDWDEDEEV